MSFLQNLLRTYNTPLAQHLSRHLGVSESEAAGVLPKIGPLVLGGLARQAQQHGPEKVEEILADQGDPAVLDDLGGFIDRQAARPEGDGGLGALLGGAGGPLGALLGGGGLGAMLGGMGGGAGGGLNAVISNGLGQYLGMDPDKAARVLPMVGPVVLGALNRARAEAGGGEAGLQAVLGFLDADGDGSLVDGLVQKAVSGAAGDGLSGGPGSGLGGLLGEKSQA